MILLKRLFLLLCFGKNLIYICIKIHLLCPVSLLQAWDTEAMQLAISVWAHQTAQDSQEDREPARLTKIVLILRSTGLVKNVEGKDLRAELSNNYLESVKSLHLFAKFNSKLLDLLTANWFFAQLLCQPLLCFLFSWALWTEWWFLARDWFSRI